MMREIYKESSENYSGNKASNQKLIKVSMNSSNQDMTWSSTTFWNIRSFRLEYQIFDKKSSGTIPILELDHLKIHKYRNQLSYQGLLNCGLSNYDSSVWVLISQNSNTGEITYTWRLVNLTWHYKKWYKQLIALGDRISKSITTLFTISTQLVVLFISSINTSNSVEWVLQKYIYYTYTKRIENSMSESRIPR